MDLSIRLILAVGIIAAIIWVLIILNSRRIEQAPPPTLRLRSFAIAACDSLVVRVDNKLDTHTRLQVFAVRAYTNTDAERMVRENMGGSETVEIVTIEIPEQWHKEYRYDRNTASSPLSPPHS